MGKNTHLNSAVARFKFNQKSRIGDINEAISFAMPMNEKEWRDYYFKNVRSEGDLKKLGSELYQKITEIVIPEIRSITEKDCTDFIRELIISKSFEGQRARFYILNFELIAKTGKQFRFLPDYPNDYKFRTYKIDYYHVDESKDLLIGIKAQPISTRQSQEPHVRKALEEILDTHKSWEAKEAGHFFVLYYSGTKDAWKIENEEILGEIASL